MYGGIDLAAKPENKTGVCLLKDEDRFETSIYHDDEEIIKAISDCGVIAIDAPLTDVEEPFRTAERELMKDFGPILPLNTPGMIDLQKRALKVKEKLEEELASSIVETYPRAVEKVSDMNSKEKFKNDHEYDAYLCALTAKSFAEDRCRRYGRKEESIYIPSNDAKEI